MQRSILFVVSVVGLLTGGCQPPHGAAAMADPDPSVKIPAMKMAVRDKDPGLARQMVKDLDNEDAAVRLYAINALERLAGQRLGYEFFADEEGRRSAVGRWQQWLVEQESRGATTSRPVSALIEAGK